jgi:hypothetical protein
MPGCTRTLAAALVSLALPAQAQSPEELRTAYLACERAAVTERMDAGGVMECSRIYEELKERVFGGDFGRLRAWSDPLLGRGPEREATDALLF